MMCCLPSGITRVSVSRAISTRITEPSGIAIGPSGNFRPEVISLLGVIPCGVVIVVPLFALEVGLALGEERLDALAEILAAAQLALEVALEVELRREIVAAGAIHR